MDDSALAKAAGERAVIEEAQRIWWNTPVSLLGEHPPYYRDRYDVEYSYRNNTHVSVRGCSWREAWDRIHGVGVVKSFLYFAKVRNE